uniref:MobA-like NTP transferase domain-containing protein n=1 Tax=Noctiluca scintillans TaxID=2966 RepID=A0A7S1AUK2_NOCSC
MQCNDRGGKVPHVNPPPPRITRALLSAAGRPTALDTVSKPKVLIDIEGSSLINHVLRQLHAGGILHVVLVISRHSAATILEVELFCECHPNLQVNIVDLTSEYKGFYAHSLLAAFGHCFQEGESGVLLATADHIFDETLVRDMCHAPLEAETQLCVLVDFATCQFQGLPPTTVGVRCSGSRVEDLSQALGRQIVRGAPRSADLGIEAGLFACTRTIFDRLAAICERCEYFTLSDAMHSMVEEGLVAWRQTDGRRWIAVETIAELASTRSTSVMRSCGSPASTPSMSPSTPGNCRELMPSFFIGGS